MTLDEAMRYRGENPATISDKVDMRENTLRNCSSRKGVEKISIRRLVALAKELDAGFLITEDGVEVELYGNRGGEV